MEEVQSDILDITEPQVFDNSICEKEWVKIVEKDVKVLDKEGNYEFVTDETSAFILPAESLIYLSGRVLKYNALTNIYEKLPAGDNTTLQNNGFNLFFEAKYLVEDKEVEYVRHLGISTLICNLCDLSRDFSKSVANDWFWYQDTADTTEINPLIYDAADKTVKMKEKDAAIDSVLNKIKNNPNYNKGYAKRSEQTELSKYVQILLPLNRIFGFCRTIRKVFRGGRHQIILTPSAEEDRIFTSENNKYKFEINQMKWLLPKIKLSLSALVVIEATLSRNEKLKYVFETVSTYKSAAINEQEGSWLVISADKKPTHVFIGFQYTDRTRNFKKNSMVFDHVDLEHIEVDINNNQLFPKNKLHTDYSTISPGWVEARFKFAEASNKTQDLDTGHLVTYKDFKNLYPVYHIDVSHHDENLYENTGNSKIKINFRLRNPPTKQFYIYAAIIFEKHIQINFIDKKIYIN
jgi:hypothetical protein